MLEEKIGYLEDYPINIKIQNIRRYPFHFHYDLEAFYVLKGFVTFKCGSSIYRMQAGDVFVINESEMHSVYDCSTDNAVMTMHANTEYFEKDFPYISDTVYRTYNKDKTDINVIKLRTFLLKMAVNNFSRKPGYKLENTELMNDLIRFLDVQFSFFYFDGKTVMQKKSNKIDMDMRLSKIICYIYKHHSEKISLTELAEQNYISNYHMSHLITEGTGLNFRELLSFARVEESEKYVLDGEKRISTIAKEMGFSTTAFYEKFFKKWYGCFPAEYREMCSGLKKGTYPEITYDISDREALDITAKALEYLSFASEFDEKKNVKHSYIRISPEMKSEGEFKPDIVFYNNMSGHEGMESSVYNIKNLMAGIEHRDIHYDRRKNKVKNNFLWDSIAIVPILIKKCLHEGHLCENTIMDYKRVTCLASGENGLFTIQGLPKSSYFCYRFLENMRGEILVNEEGCLATKDSKEGYNILFYNTCADMDELFAEPQPANITYDRIKKYQGVVEGFLSIEKCEGVYHINTTTLSNETSILAMAKDDNFHRRKMTMLENDDLSNYTFPHVSHEEVYKSGRLEMSVTLKGVSCTQIRVIKKV